MITILKWLLIINYIIAFISIISAYKIDLFSKIRNNEPIQNEDEEFTTVEDIAKDLKTDDLDYAAKWMTHVVIILLLIPYSALIFMIMSSLKKTKK